CVLCRRTDDCPEKYGEKSTYVEYNLTVHYYCLLMSSGIWQRGEEDEGIYGFLVTDIRKEVNRAAKLKCNICKKKGASIGCVAPKCKRSYHFPCGVQKECIFQFMEDFRSYCWEHKPVQKFSVKGSRESSQCVICLELVEQLPLYSVLKSPCCKNAWFHRECLQYHALSAGVFFFRCSVCNNKDKFQKEMLRMGIHIPENKDSDNVHVRVAFLFLLQDFPGEREIKTLCCIWYRDPKIKWEIKRCQCCGSRGTHLACSSMKSWEQNWECVECRSIFAKSGNYSKQQKRSLATSEKTGGTTCLLEEPSPKCPRPSSASQHSFLLQSPKIMCQSNVTPCSRLEFPASNRMTMPLSPLMANRSLSLQKKHLSQQRREVSNILKELKLQVNTKTTRLNINTENIWNSALKGFRQRSFSPTNAIEIKFTGCRNRLKTDTSDGSKHRFFKLLMLNLQNSSLFEGSSVKNLTLDSQALKENLYFEAGRMIAVSLVHGGPSLGFFSKTLFDCLVYGPENVKPALEDVADVGVAQTIKMIKYSNSLSSLQSTVHDCYEFLAAAGCLRPVTTLCDKNMLVNDILVYHVIKRITSPLERFSSECSSIKTNSKPCLCNREIKVHFCKLLLNFPKDSTVISGLLKYELTDLMSGESVVTLEDILLFATGCSSVPPIGFDPEPTVKFLHIRYPIGNKLHNCLELPITKTYEQFKNKMEFTIRNTLKVERE
ncbi:G2E3 ligase, partial [Nothocercus nigrocapillus]|nr:G2E3 ligase [Nothocercus nigrocapillus]